VVGYTKNRETKDMGRHIGYIIILVIYYGIVSGLLWGLFNVIGMEFPGRLKGFDPSFSEIFFITLFVNVLSINLTFDDFKRRFYGDG